MANLTDKERNALQAIKCEEDISDKPKAVLFMLCVYMPILYLIMRG